MSEKEPKLEWMYKGLSGHVDKEEYLMGRKIDKTFDLIRAEETGTSKGDLEIDGADVLPKSIFAGASGSGAMVTADVMGKLREDPLLEIKKREIDKQKEILNNPLRMKKIKEMIKRTIGSSTDSSSDSDSDDQRRHRHKKSKKKKHRRDRSEERTSHRDRHRSPDRRDRDRDRGKQDSDRRSDRHRHDRHRSRTRSRSRDRRQADRRDERHQEDRHRDRDRRSERTDDRDHHRDHRNQNPSSNNRPAPSRPQRPPPKAKLSAEEMERRRQQMMSDAVDREQDRKNRVESIKKEEELEAQRSTTTRTGGSFIKDQLTRTMNEDTLEKQIKGRSFKSQSSRAMDSNFARK